MSGLCAGYDPDLARVVGLAAAALYAKLVFLSRTTTRKDKFCWYSGEKCERELGITIKAQKTAIKRLVEGGYITTKNTYQINTKIKVKHFYFFYRSVVDEFAPDSYQRVESESDKRAESEKTQRTGIDLYQREESGSDQREESIQSIQYRVFNQYNKENNIVSSDFSFDSDRLKITARITELCIKELGKNTLYEHEKKQIHKWVYDFGITDALVTEAFEKNHWRNHLSMKIIDDTLTKWNGHGIRTIEAAERFCEEEHNANIRKAARKTSIHGAKWRTGAEAGIDIPDEETTEVTNSAISTKETSTVKQMMSELFEVDGIPSDVLDMFGETVKKAN